MSNGAATLDAADRGAAYLDKRAQRRESAVVGMRQPAYANRVHALRRDGKAPWLGVLIKDGWGIADFYDDDFGPWSLVVPNDVPLSQLDFRCIAGLHCFVIADTRRQVHDIAEQVHKSAPKQIWGIPGPQYLLTTYFREVA